MKKVIMYILALLIGAALGFFIVFNSVFTDSSGNISERLITFALTAFSYFLSSFVLGYIMPEKSWHWSAAISIPAIIIITLYVFRETDVMALSIMYLILAVASASFGARTGTLIRYKAKS